MSELSVEQKANRYDKILKEVKDFFEGKQKMQNDITKTLEHLFPELNDPNDEQMWELVKNYVSNISDLALKTNHITREYLISWLKKQEQSKKISIWKHWKNGIAGNGEGKLIFLIKSGPTYSLSSCLSFECDYIELSELENLMLEKQSEQKSVEDSLTFEEFKNAFITKAKQYDIDLPNRSWDIHALCKELYSLKHKSKQGEQKPFDYENANIQQKDFAPKVEPKFKVGDWITDGNITIQIEAIKNNCYSYCGDCTLYSIKTADKVYHLWTIEDAKPGDVLNANGIFIYKKHDKDCVYFYCGINLTGEFICTCVDDIWSNNYKVYPATKEQYDLLFKKIQESGYEWDIEKKMLKNIPKFKAGDWIIFNGLTLYINEVAKGYYRTISKGGIPNSYDWNIDNAARLWTINEARDGDILRLGDVIAIFKKYIGQEKCICYCSFCEDGNGFEIPIENGEDNVYGCIDTTPATKEQRDLLFTRMKESNYMWDENIKRVIKYGE